MSPEEDDPFFQLSNEGDSSQNEPTPPKKEEKPTPPKQEEDPFAALGGDTSNTPPKGNSNVGNQDPFAALGNDTKNSGSPSINISKEDNQDLHDDNLNFFASSSSSEASDFFHEDDHNHDDLEQHTQNDFDTEANDDPFTKLGGGFMDFAGSGSTQNTTSSSSQGGFMDFANSGTNQSDPNQGGFSQGSSQQAYNPQSGGYPNTGAYNQQNPTNNLGSPLGAQQAQYTQNRYQEFQSNLQGSQNFMNQFQNNINAIQPNRGSYPPPVGNAMIDNVSYMSALGQKLYFKDERQKTSAEEKAEVDGKMVKIIAGINKDIKSYRHWELIAKRWAFIFKFLSSALAAIVTVLLGINITDTLRSYGIDWWINFFALVISAFISLIGVFQSFYDSDQLWIKYTDTANKLERLLSTVEYVKLSGDYLNLNDINSIKIEYDRIIESTHNYELQVRAENDETSDRIRQEGMMNQNSQQSGQYYGNTNSNSQYNNR
jgi:hypothetical protein